MHLGEINVKHRVNNISCTWN